MNKIFRNWIIGVIIIVVAFLTFSPPSQWHLYLDEIINTPLLITFQQSAYLILGGAVLGSALMIIEEMFT